MAMGTFLQKWKVPNFWKSSKKSILGADVGTRGGEVPNHRQASIDKTDDCVMNSERGMRSFGAPRER